MNRYTEVTLIVEGALEDSWLWADAYNAEIQAERLARELAGKGLEYDIYLTDHEHSEYLECDCIQYLTDHRPYLSSDRCMI